MNQVASFVFDKDFNPKSQIIIKDRQVGCLADEVYVDEENFVNCVKNHDKKVNLYLLMNEPVLGYYKYVIDTEKNEFMEAKQLFEFGGIFSVFNRRFLETENGLLFVTNEAIGGVAPNASSRTYKQQLYRIEYKLQLLL